MHGEAARRPGLRAHLARRYSPIIHRLAHLIFGQLSLCAATHRTPTGLAMMPSRPNLLQADAAGVRRRFLEQLAKMQKVVVGGVHQLRQQFAAHTVSSSRRSRQPMNGRSKA